MMEAKRPATILARIQAVYYENPTPGLGLDDRTIIDRPGINLLAPLLVIYMDHFDLRWVWYGCSLICPLA